MGRDAVSSSKNYNYNFLSGTASDDIEREIIADIAAGVGAPDVDRDVFQRLSRTISEEGKLPFDFTEQERFFLRNQSRDRANGYLIYRYKFFLAGHEKVAFDFPPYLLIEPVSACNLRCPMCFQVDPSFTRKPYMGMMKMDLFTSIIDQAAEEGCYAITLASRGEPLLHPKIGEMLAYLSAKKHFFDIKINTNATLLTEELCHALLSSDLNILVFSIDHYEKESYEKIRVNANFEQVKQNLGKIHEIREKHYPDSKCEFRISGVRVDQNLDEDAFLDYWGASFANVSLADKEERWDTYANEPRPTNCTVCNFLWDRMYVWFDGKCNPCDLDYKSFLSYGDATKRPLKEIWNGPELARLRSLHNNNRRAQVVPCDRCGLYFD